MSHISRFSTPNNPFSQKLLAIYFRLFTAYGPQRWWPGETPFEVMVGAVLTQSTAWTNVEKAIANLKKTKVLSPHAIRNLRLLELSALIRPSGYYKAKARKLKELAEWLGKTYGDNITKMSVQKPAVLREQLLTVHGVGPETADSIILYATKQPIFVIDAYTRRILDRLGVSPETRTYTGYQALFMDNLLADAQMFNEYHALLVQLGKDACRKKPLSAKCCLRNMCRFGNE